MILGSEYQGWFGRWEIGGGRVGYRRLVTTVRAHRRVQRSYLS
jgi:hypothetical protein